MAKPKNLIPIIVMILTAFLLFAYAISIKFTWPFGPRTECASVGGEEYIEFTTARTYIENYILDSNTDPALIGLYGDYAMGANISDCLIETLRLQITRPMYRESFGIQIRYGLQNRGDDRNSQRIAILLPLNSDGRAMALEDSDQVFSLVLPPNFQDPCPPHCDQ